MSNYPGKLPNSWRSATRLLFVAVSIAFSATLGIGYAGAERVIQGNSALQLEAAIPLPGVEGRIDHLAVTPDGKQLFVAAFGNDVVARIGIGGRIVIDKIRGIKEPQGLSYVPKSHRLAVASGGDGKVRIYNQDLKLIGTVNSLEDADNARYDSSEDLLYVGYGNGNLAIIDPNKSIKLGEILLDGHPESFQLEQNGKRIFVNVPTAGEIEILDRKNRLVLTRWKLTAASGNFPMALDERNQRLLVGCRTPARLLILNTASGQVVANMNACGDTDDVFYDSGNREIYLSGGHGCISVFNAANPNSYKQLPSITTPAGSRTSILAETSRAFYVAVPQRGLREAEILIFRTGLSSPAFIAAGRSSLPSSKERWSK